MIIVSSLLFLIVLDSFGWVQLPPKPVIAMIGFVAGSFGTMVHMLFKRK